MSEEPPAKRRRVDPTLSASRRNENRVERTTSFRKYMACFLLVSPMTGATRPERQRRRYTYASTGILDSSAKKSVIARRLLHAGPSRLECPDDMDWVEYVHYLASSQDLEPEEDEQIERMMKVCLEGYEEAYLKGQEPKKKNKKKKKNRAHHRGGHRARPSAFGRRSGLLRSTQTGDQVLRYLLRLYGIRCLKKFLSGKVLGCSDQMAKEFVSFGRDSLINSLVEMYRTGTLPLARRAEEGRVLEEMDVNDLQFDLCGVSVPLDLMRLIMTFLQHDYDLVTGVGVVSWDFYVLVLLTWQLIEIRKKPLFMIPKIVFRVVPEIWMYSPRKPLLMKELSYVFDHLSRENLRCLRMAIPRNAKYLPCQRRFGLLWKSAGANGKLMGLRKFCLSVYSNRTDEDDSWRSIRLFEVAPNLECVENPFWLDWCEGLARLQSLSTASHVLHACDPAFLETIASSVSELTLARDWRVRSETGDLDCSSQFGVLLPRLSSFTLTNACHTDLTALLRLPSPELESLSVSFDDYPGVGFGEGLALSPKLRVLLFHGPVNLPFATQLILARPVLSHLAEVRLWKDLDVNFGVQELNPHVPHLESLQLLYTRGSRVCLDITIRNRGCGVRVALTLRRGLSAEDICPTASQDLRTLLPQHPPSSFEIDLTMGNRIIIEGEDEEDRLDAEFETVLSSLMGSIESSYQDGREGLLRDCVISSKREKYVFSKSLVWHRRE